MSRPSLRGMVQWFHEWMERYLVPTRPPKSDLGTDRDRVLIYIHLIALAAAACNVGLELLLSGQFTASLLGFCVLLAGLLFVFRRFGNLVLSGNLLAATIAAVLLEGIGQSGGLYSDNLLWLLLVPVTAFLFASRRWGVVWSLGLLAVLLTLYLLERGSVESYRYASLEFSATYYFVSYLGLFAGLLGVILLFLRSNDDTLARLRATTEQLRIQEAGTAEQNELLRSKEAELKRSNRDLELFAYVASHDLKEPLRMMSSYAQLLTRDLKDTLPERQATYLGFVEDGASRMKTMLDDLLSYSRLGKERQAEQEVDLNKVLALVANFLRESLLLSGGKLEVEPHLPTLRGHHTQFLQVFQNLVANALKFVSPGQAPRVQVQTFTLANGEVALSVRDNGIGISSADSERIFGVFQRLHTREHYSGSGIGLATVKRIVDGLGGRVEVTSVAHEGSVFTVYFPAERVV